MIDSHCHLADARFSLDRAAVLQRAVDAGIHCIIVPTAQQSEWNTALSLQQSKAPQVVIAYGLHPWFCQKHQHADLILLKSLLDDAVAVGECGLDFAAGRVEKELQLYYFRAQLSLADSAGLPVIVHAHKSLDIIIRELKPFPSLRAIIHGFSGSYQQALILINSGHYLGIGSRISFPQAAKLRDTIQKLPLNQLLLESDAPDQPQYLQRSKRNEPAFLGEVVQALATLHQCTGKDVIQQTTANARALFKL